MIDLKDAVDELLDWNIRDINKVINNLNSNPALVSGVLKDVVRFIKVMRQEVHLNE